MTIHMNIEDKNNKMSNMKRLVILIILFTSAYYLNGQNRVITGRVISDDLIPVPGAEIFINDTIRIGITDMRGFYRIEISDTIKKIEFLFPGLEPAIIELVDNCDIIEIVMMYSGSYDFISLRRADRIRKRKFKKLPKIHKLAYEKGIFKTREPCYVRKFR